MELATLVAAIIAAFAALLQAAVSLMGLKKKTLSTDAPNYAQTT